MYRFTKRTTAAAAVLTLAVTGGAAYAYWTAGGSGSGSAATDDALAALTVNQSTVLSPMYPGDSAQTISGTFNNPNPGPAYVGTVTASISSVYQGAAVAVGCSAADYTLANAAMTVGVEVAAGNGTGAWTGATLKFNNTAANQDACKNATVNLAYVIS